MKRMKIKNKYIFLDDKDFDLISKYKWQLAKGRKTYYAIRTTSNPKTTIRMHREILGLKETGEHVDHINGNGLDNTKKNLRICSRDENGRNRRPNKGYKYKGVIKSNGNKYVAKIKREYLGTYNTPEEAANIYNKYAKKYFGEFANLNKVKSIKNIKKNTRKATESTKLKMSIAKKGKLHSNSSIPIICNETSQLYPSIAEAARRHKTDCTTIWRVVKGIRKGHRGLTFSYLTKE